MRDDEALGAGQASQVERGDALRDDEAFGAGQAAQVKPSDALRDDEAFGAGQAAQVEPGDALRDDEAFGGFYVAGKSHFHLSKIVWLLRLTHGNAPEGGYYLAAIIALIFDGR